MNPGQIIILNGGSSAGKTSLAKAIQNIMPEPYMLLGIDVFWMSMPQKQIDLETVDPEYYTWVEEEHNGRPYFRIIPGPILDSMMIARYYAIAEYLRRGLNVVADDVVWSPLWLEETIKALDGFKAFFIGVFCDDEVAAGREIHRGDRYGGWARGSQIYAHKDAIYDLTLDSSFETPEQCAQTIKEALDSGLHAHAFEQMKKRFALQPSGDPLHRVLIPHSIRNDRLHVIPSEARDLSAVQATVLPLHRE
jgi:chloramphenicol 3-O phosphotransferase